MWRLMGSWVTWAALRGRHTLSLRPSGNSGERLGCGRHHTPRVDALKVNQLASARALLAADEGGAHQMLPRLWPLAVRQEVALQRRVGRRGVGGLLVRQGKVSHEGGPRAGTLVARRY